MPQLSERIRAAREQKEMTKAVVARSLGVNPSAVAQWEMENGTSPSSAHLAKLAKLLDVAYEWLATGRGAARVLTTRDSSALEMSTFAQTLFEERLLELSRRLPPRSHDPLIRLLESFLANGSNASRRRKSSDT